MDGTRYNPEDMSDDLREEIAAAVQQDLNYVGVGDYLEDGMNRTTVTVELIENGMLVHYYEPVEKVMQPPAHLLRSPQHAGIEAFFKTITATLKTAAEDAKNDESRRRMDILAKNISESFESIRPKAEKRWVLERRTVSAHDGQDLMKVIERAKEADKKTVELRQQGHHVAGGDPYGVGEYPTPGMGRPIVPLVG